MSRILKSITSIVLCSVVLVFVAAGGAYGQVDGNTAGPVGTKDANGVDASVLPATDEVAEAAKLSVEQLLARKKAAVESPEASEEAKAKVGEAYDKAVAQLGLLKQVEAEKQQYRQARESAPGRLVEVRGLLAKMETAAPEAAGDVTLAQAEQSLALANPALAEARKKAADLENEPKRRAERRTKIPQETTAARQEIEDVKARLAVLAQSDQKSALAQANRLLLLLQQATLQSRVEANTEEMLFYDAANDLLSARRDLAVREQAAAEKLASFWQEQVNQKRKVEAEAAQQEAIRASRETESAYPFLQQIAKDNATLAQLQADLTGQTVTVSQNTKVIDDQLISVEKDFREIKERVDKAGGITDVMGVLLLAKRGSLPGTAEHRRNIRKRLSEISNAQLEWSKYDSEWSVLSDMDKHAEEILSAAEPPVPESRRAATKAEVISYLQAKRRTLKAISDLYLAYSTALANLDNKERALVKTVEEYTSFIDENILWVKSADSLSLDDLHASVRAMKWLFSPANWRNTAAIVVADSRRNPLQYLLILVIGGLFAVFHSRMHRRISAISKEVQEVRKGSFLPTVKALLTTILLAVMWPAFLLLTQQRVLAAGPEDSFVTAVAFDMRKLAFVIFVLSFLRHMALPNGLAQDHFRMREEAAVFLRRHLLWLSFVIIPAFFIVQAIHAQTVDEQWYGTAGRLAFMIGTGGLAVFLIIALHPGLPLMKFYFDQQRGGWLERLRFFWYPLCAILPSVLVVLAGMGYLYGAQGLNDRLLKTILIGILAILVRAILVRWLTVARRRLALLERAKQKAVATEAAGKSAESSENKARQEQTIFEMSRQTRRFINAVTTIILLLTVWYVWNDVLPAFAVFGKVELWKTTTASGAVEVISLGSLMIAILTGLLTVAVARNMPGLLEIVILRRLPLDRGARFAITTVCRYILIVVGVVLIFTEIGVGWSKVQWLVAAMTVGLGFGLQEIFANFISGLIILFEQPIRVDDVVTISDVTGTVTNIRIRATTIRKWDQKELIVPNKEFMTGRLINWTLTDSVLRLDFTVGIAYGSDIAKAERLLYEVAKANPKVLKEPEPIVLFRDFGNSSLDFELRVYVSGIDNRLPVWHEINCAIDTAFRAAGVEIAFPQRDIHVRSVSKGIPVDLGPGPDSIAPPRT